ncbi:MAG: hypothetical protein RR034_01520 [Bacteroidales bacterium]
MKMINNGKIYIGLIILLIFSVFTISCSRNKEKILVEKTISFPGNDWNYEQRVLFFDAIITDTTSPCRVELEIEYDTLNELDKLPVTLSINHSGGAKSAIKSGFVFKKTENSMKGTSSDLFQKKVVVFFKEKYFNHSGHYTFEVYRYSPKYNNYGFKSLTLRVIKLPESAKQER